MRSWLLGAEAPALVQRGRSRMVAWLRACCGPLTSKRGRNGEEPLVAGARALVVVHEFERTFPQLHDRRVGRRTDVELTAVIKGREHARRIDGSRRVRQA